MLVLIFLLGILSLAIFLVKIADRFGYDFLDYLGIGLSFIVSMLMLAHIVLWSVRSWDYELTIAKKEAFEQTLGQARENGNQYEIATITVEIVRWNESIAAYKRINKSPLWGCYVDNRFESVKYIK